MKKEEVDLANAVRLDSGFEDRERRCGSAVD